jgi:FimV-like protein
MRNSSQAATPAGFARTAIRRGLMIAAISSASMLYSTLASALGMGDITLHSALNQPLNAEIELVETAGLSAEDIVAKLASPEAFARAGVDRQFFFNDLRFTPVIKGNRGVIRVVSNKPVTEPYLQFLVQLSRPNGDLQHEYTLLLDPATSPAGRAAVSSRNRDSAAQAAPQSRMPVSPPSASQGKRYVVASGDTLNSIARRVQGSGAKGSASQLADGIKALNPQAFGNGDGTTLKIGQSLALPDAAVLPSSDAAPAQAAAAPPGAATAAQSRSAEQLTASVIENQALSKTVEDLRLQLQSMQEQIDGRDKQISGLQTALAERESAVPPAAVLPVAASPVAAAPVAAAPPQVAAEPEGDSILTSPLLLGAVAILLLLLGLAFSVRRNRQKEQSADPISAEHNLIKPAQTPIVPAYEVPIAVVPVSKPASTPAASRPAASRPAGAAPDALDGVSIYIAYGRFAEAMGILREALIKQPERADIRIKMLELLGEQNDSAGFAQEERNALEHGVPPQQVEDIRARYPKLKPADQAATDAPQVAAALIPPVTVALAASSAAAEPAQLDESAAAALNPEPADDFKLNLDSLSLDADWDLVDPFDTPASVRGKPAVAPEPEEDPDFASNLTEFPEVQEIPDDRFLSDFADEVPIVESNSDALDDAFLDGFMDDSSDFDLLGLDDAPLSKVNQAQVLIDEGDIDGARALLLEVLEESDEEHQQTARDLLAGL